MHGLDPGLTQLEFDIEIEVRGIDADEHVWFRGDQVGHQLLTARQQFTQPTQDFHQAHHRQTFHGKVGRQAFGLHQRAADTDELDRRMASLQRAHQTRAQNVAGSLTCHQRNTQIGHG
ncbi:hypothetical protein D3C76_1556200 [compost metagenome]